MVTTTDTPYRVGQRVIIPRLDKGGVVVAISGDTHTVDFDRNDTGNFGAAELQPHD